MPKLNLETKNKAQELVKAYLEENASEILADKINNGVRIQKDGKTLINKKTLDGFMAFATDEARKQAEKSALRLRGRCRCFRLGSTLFRGGFHRRHALQRGRHGIQSTKARFKDKACRFCNASSCTQTQAADVPLRYARCSG